MLKLIKEFVCFFLDTDSYSGRSDVKNPQLLDELSQIVSIKVKTTWFIIQYYSGKSRLRRCQMGYIFFIQDSGSSSFIVQKRLYIGFNPWSKVKNCPHCAVPYCFIRCSAIGAGLGIPAPTASAWKNVIPVMAVLRSISAASNRPAKRSSQSFEAMSQINEYWVFPFQDSSPCNDKFYIYNSQKSGKTQHIWLYPTLMHIIYICSCKYYAWGRKKNWLDIFYPGAVKCSDLQEIGVKWWTERVCKEDSRPFTLLGLTGNCNVILAYQL